MRLLPVPLLMLLAACAGGSEPLPNERSEWQYRANTGYVNVRTMEQKSPQELLDHASTLQQAKRPVQAAMIFNVLAHTAPDPSTRAGALWGLATAAGNAGAWRTAFNAFDTFQSRFPDDDLATRAKLMMMECALELGRAGEKESVLGIPMYTSSKAGIELLQNTLNRFPREDFSDDYCYKLAEFHHERGEADLAEAQLNTILTDPAYQRSNSAPRALLFLGQIGLERYAGVWYDHKMIADAKRAYERFLSDYQQFADEPAKAAEYGIRDFPKMIVVARAGIRTCEEALAERELTVAEYYADRDRPEAAKLHLGIVLKTYPETRAAQRAQKRLQDFP